MSAGSAPSHRQRGEHLVGLLGRAQRGGLCLNNPGMRRLGDPDEGHLPAQRDQRQPVLFARSYERGRQRAESAAQLDHQSSRVRAGELFHICAKFGRRVGQRNAGGQDDLAAGQQPGDVRQLAHVHPANPAGPGCRGRPTPPAGRPSAPAGRAARPRSAKLTYCQILPVRLSVCFGGELGAEPQHREAGHCVQRAAHAPAGVAGNS